MASSMSAEIIGTAARYDQQFQVPDLPVVRLGAAVVEDEDGDVRLIQYAARSLDAQIA